MTPPFQPGPCAACGSGGTGGPLVDTEQTLLCDVDATGHVLAHVLMVQKYDETTGAASGPPVPVNANTGAPYVPVGTLQPCEAAADCGAPQQFCFSSSAPVNQPGRMYDLTFSLAQGFAVQSIVKDLVETPVNITWEVTDPDGSAFASSLQTAIQSQFPGKTVTVTPGVVDPCAATSPFTVHIECLRLDQSPPTLLQLKYNAGRDLIVNPSFLTTPPSTPSDPLTFVKRQDTVAPTGTKDVLCTNVADRGWETNDSSKVFELWGPPGSPQNGFEGTTPTPRGTSVQEINAFGSGPVPVAGGAAGNPAFGQNPDTIWQTFSVPAAGNFNIRVVVGGRATTENIPIKLSTGDVNDTGIGDIINTSVNAAKVTTENSSPAGPWTTFNQTVPLTAGLYTLAFTGPTQQDVPGGNNAFGGLFTDMRVFQDAPNTLATFTNDDVTCTVPTTVTSTVCEFWAPRCSDGQIVGWYNVADGESLSNAAFWAQVPAPTCCTAQTSGSGESTGNLIHTYLVCGTLNGIRRTMSRVVVTDQSGGIISDTFVDTDGGPVTPNTWQPGSCSQGGHQAEFVLCEDFVPFIRKVIQDDNGVVTSVVNLNLDGTPRTVTGTVGTCGTYDVDQQLFCDANGTPFIREYVYNNQTGVYSFLNDRGIDGVLVSPVPPIGPCGECVPVYLGRVCTTGNPGFTQELAVVRECDGTTHYYNPATGAEVVAPVIVVCSEFQFAEEILCDNTGPFLRRYSYNASGITGFVDVELDGATPHVVAGTVTSCDTSRTRDSEAFILCDSAAPTPNKFIRTRVYDDTGAIVSTTDTTLAGAAFVPTGAVQVCPDMTVAVRDSEAFILCDSASPTPNRFIRTRVYDATGAIVTTVDTTLAGAAFVPTGAVQICSTPTTTDFDFTTQILCDANQTPYIQRLTYNSSTGAVTGTTNTTLTGGAFTPVGASTLCTNCCPTVIGNGCTNTGSGFYTAIRNANGTISLIDSVTGATITGANIVACPSDATVRTLTAQARVLTNATPWTPGADVAGTLTSASFTGLSGTWDLVDANGTAVGPLPAGATVGWTAEDDNILTGPQSVTPAAGSTVLASWTQR